MGLGDFLGKLITAPIKIIAMPIQTIRDVVDSDVNDGLVGTVTKSIESQVKEIVD